MCSLFPKEILFGFYSTTSVKLHNETHIIKNTVMKQSMGLNGYLKPEHTHTHKKNKKKKKNTHTHTHTHKSRTMMGTTTSLCFLFLQSGLVRKVFILSGSVCQQWPKLLYLDQYILFKHMSSSFLGELVCSGHVQQYQIQMQAYLLRSV